MAYVSSGFTPAGVSTGGMGVHTYINTADTLANNVTALDEAEVSDNVRVGDTMIITGSDGSKIHTVTAIVASGNITLSGGLVITA